MPHCFVSICKPYQSSHFVTTNSTLAFSLSLSSGMFSDGNFSYGIEPVLNTGGEVSMSKGRGWRGGIPLDEKWGAAGGFVSEVSPAHCSVERPRVLSLSLSLAASDSFNSLSLSVVYLFLSPSLTHWQHRQRYSICAVQCQKYCIDTQSHGVCVRERENELTILRLEFNKMHRSNVCAGVVLYKLLPARARLILKPGSL